MADSASVESVIGADLGPLARLPDVRTSRTRGHLPTEYLAYAAFDLEAGLWLVSRWPAASLQS